MLNIKEMALKMQGDGPKRLYLRAIGPGEVTAGMIELPGDIEIMDPKHLICHARRRRLDLDGADRRHR